jgi:hypothetical protein
MDTPTINAKIVELQEKVVPYSRTKNGIPYSFSLGSYMTSTKVYMVIPVIILFILLFWRPDFIKYDTDKGVRKLSFKKVLMYWLIISASIVIGLFGYNYKTR